jgi:hypothetical protein
MEDLAQRIESGYTWDDLVLPETQRNTLSAIVTHVRQRAKVYEHWGFGGKNQRGLTTEAENLPKIAQSYSNPDK